MAEDEGVTPEQEQAPEQGTPEDDGAGGKDALKADLARERKERQKWQRDYESLRKQSMSDAEKAVAEAEERGRSAGRAEGFERVLRSDFTAAAARRNPEYDVTRALEYVNVSKFLDETGDIDAKALTAAVEQLVPEVSTPRPRGDVGQGARPSSGGGFNGNDFLRQHAGR